MSWLQPARGESAANVGGLRPRARTANSLRAFGRYGQLRAAISVAAVAKYASNLHWGWWLDALPKSGLRTYKKTKF